MHVEQPRSQFDELQRVFADRGISMTYTERIGDLMQKRLKQYDALIVYANIDSIDKQYADSILNA